MQIRKHAENCSCNYICLSGLLNSLSNKVIQIKVPFIAPYRDRCPFQEILETTSTLKGTSLSFKIVSFVKNTRPTKSFLY